MKQTNKEERFDPATMFILPENKGDDMLLQVEKMPEMLATVDENFSRAEFLFSCQRLAKFLREKDCLNLDGSDAYIEHITTSLIGLKADNSRKGIFNTLNEFYGEELKVYGSPAQHMFESLFSYCIENKLWETIKNGPWSWPLFGLVSFVIKPTIAFNVLEKHWKYDNEMKKRLHELLEVRSVFRKALDGYEKWLGNPAKTEGKEHLIAAALLTENNKYFILSSDTWSTDKTMKMLDNMIYLGQHPSENCAADFSEVLQYIEMLGTYQAVDIPQSKRPIVRIAEEDCVNFMAQALHYYTACYSIRKASDTIDEKYKDFYPEGKDAVTYLAIKVATALSELTETHNAEVIKRQEERKRQEEEERKAKEEEMRKVKEKIKARHVKFEEEGFKLFSENNTYEKWIKESNGQEVNRFFIKATTPSDRLSFFKGLEELGLSNGKVRNTKNPAGVLRYIKLGDEEIGTDTLVEKAVGRVYRMSSPLTRRETLDITDTLFTLASDKVFFSLEDLEKAADRIKPAGITLSDIRGLIKMMRDRGMIGQVKTKKKGAKIFALTVEGMVIARNRVDTKYPLIHLPWSDAVGEIVNERAGKADILEVVSIPIKNIDAMIDGKASKFLGKYYVTEL